MAGEKIKLAELDFDVKLLLQKTYEVADSLKYMKDQQRLLLEEQKKYSSETVNGRNQIAALQTQYEKNKLTIKSLGIEYTSYQKAVQAQVNKAGELVTKEQAVKVALDLENISIASARDNNRELLAIRNQLNPAIAEQAQLIQELNKKYDENIAYIKENGSAFEKQKMEIGDYKDQIIGAFAELNIFNGGLTGFIMRSQQAGGAGVLLGNAFRTMTTGIVGLTKAALAFIATPLGAILAAIAAAVLLVVGAFKFMTASMKSTEEGSNKLAKAMAAVSGIFNGFWKIIKPLGEWLGDVFIGTLEAVGDMLEWMTDKIADAMEFVGMDEAAEGLRDFKDEVKAASQAAVELAQAEADLDKAQRKSKITQLEYQKQAEKLRQQRDDESNSISERIRLNDELGVVLQKQLKDELAIAEQALKVANLRIKSEGATKETLDAQAAALTEIADIQERVTGQESEQLANLNSLRKEAADAEKERQEKAAAARKKALEDYAAKLNLELQLYQQANDGKNTSLDKQLAYAKEVQDKALAIAQAEYKASEKTSNDKLALQIRENEIRKEYLDAQAQAVIAASEKEYQAVLAANKTKLDNNKYLTDEMVQQELTRMDIVNQAERENLQKQFENKVITQQQLNTELERINEENQKAADELTRQRTEAENARKLTDLENRRAAEQLAFEQDAALQLERLQIEQAQEIAAAEKTGADIATIEKKYAKQRQDIEEAVMNNKLELASQTFGNLATIFGKESKVGKALAVAQATIDTYQAANAAYKAMAGIPVVGPALGAVAAGAAVATGIQNVKKITSTDTPKAEKGALFSIGGNRHSEGGTLFTGADGTQFEAEKGELIGVMNRNAAAHFMAFNNAFPAGRVPVPNHFASGGIVSRQETTLNLDYDILANKIADANTLRPAPVVAVTDIITQGSNHVKVVDNASI